MFSFVVFIYIMNTIYYQPVLKIIKERQALVDGNYEKARQSGEKTGELDEQTRTQLDAAAQKAKSVIAATIEKATASSAEQTKAAQKQSQMKISQAKEKLAKEEEKLTTQLEIKELSKSISKKILGGAA